jgi:hypothetical protein
VSELFAASSEEPAVPEVDGEMVKRMGRRKHSRIFTEVYFYST